MIGVVITVYSSADVILDCVESLFGQDEPVRLVIVDNASPDDSIDRLKAWAAARGSACARSPPPRRPRRLAGGAALAPLTVVRAPANLGYAGAVNLGLAVLAPRPEVGLLWVLNPDCVVPPGTLGRARRAPRPRPAASR